MQKKYHWLTAVFLALWVVSCAHAPDKATQATQQPAAQVAATLGTPVAEVPETEFDFGVLTDDGEYVHDFKVFNKGNGPLEIKKVLTA
jgi:hypothetical protein